MIVDYLLKAAESQWKEMVHWRGRDAGMNKSKCRISKKDGSIIPFYTFY